MGQSELGCLGMLDYDNYAHAFSDNKLRYLFRRSGLAIGNTFGAGSGPIWLDNVVCNGTENALEDCSHNDWNNSNCDHETDISITCNTNLTNTIGKLQ